MLSNSKHKIKTFFYRGVSFFSVNGLFDSRYNCCQGDSSSEGCQVGKVI